jgi:6-phosphofructokinase 1
MAPSSTGPERDQTIRRVAILFSGGPAPAANAVISTAAASFLRNGIEVIGLMHGYSHLLEYSEDRPLQEGRDYIRIDQRVLKRSRNSRGILIGTARANPGKLIKGPKDLADPAKSAPLKAVHDALVSLGVDALVSIGGDDTLKTANKLVRFQEHLPEREPRIAVVHVPKTIDNDYRGIDFTFGYFTAVETLAGEIMNLLADAEANRSYFLCETMGRSAGWLAYGAAIAGEASFVFSVEDVIDSFRGEEVVTDPDTGAKRTRPIVRLERLVERIVKTMRVREQDGKQFGVIVLAEGLAEFLPEEYLKGIAQDEFGHISIAQVHVATLFSRLVAAEYERQTGKKKRVTGLQLGYEARCALPHAFDVILGSQLGVGAYRALVERKLNGVMISVQGQLNLNYVPFHELIDPETMVTVVRFIERGSDFHQLAKFLETNVPDLTN